MGITDHHYVRLTLHEQYCVNRHIVESKNELPWLPRCHAGDKRSHKEYISWMPLPTCALATAYPKKKKKRAALFTALSRLQPFNGGQWMFSPLLA